MSTVKVAITIDKELLGELDRLVAEEKFPNRSNAFQVAVREKLKRMRCNRFADECAKFDKVSEQALADEGLALEVEQWPEY